MDKRRKVMRKLRISGQQVADCTKYKQDMISLGYAPHKEDMSHAEEHKIYSGLIIKIGARCFFCNQEGHFRMESPVFFCVGAVKNQGHSKHKLALAAVQNTRNRQAETDLKSKEEPMVSYQRRR